MLEFDHLTQRDGSNRSHEGAGIIPRRPIMTITKTAYLLRVQIRGTLCPMQYRTDRLMLAARLEPRA